MSTYEVVTTVTSALAVILPAVVVACHKFGYEVPFLSKLADILASRPRVLARRNAKK